MSPEQRKHLAVANRWHSRKKGARSRRDVLRCHEQAMRHFWSALGRPDKLRGPLL